MKVRISYIYHLEVRKVFISKHIAVKASYNAI
nr:MAG TPA: hypothetical protein [Caudoviricetes sp.]DAZ30152.1 MAG TPA: hypothetical protein [Caudoviricetes sp.]